MEAVVGPPKSILHIDETRSVLPVINMCMKAGKTLLLALGVVEMFKLRDERPSDESISCNRMQHIVHSSTHPLLFSRVGVPVEVVAIFSFFFFFFHS